ncbi:MAG: ASKHA domain-containing protein [Acidimicrobiia bacterium]|nr:MAG: ASKHA domain-containing protein [Acidimicrobiia bacterium]
MTVVSGNGEIRPIAIDKTLFDYADELALELPTSCGRTGQCHECVVEVKQGMGLLTPRSDAEIFLGDDYRLACQARITDVADNIEFAPLRRRRSILEPTQRAGPVQIAPMVTRVGEEVFHDSALLGRFRGTLLGLAIDLGTTTIVLELVDLETGQTLAVSSFENPQRFGGSDVMRRISYDADETASGELQQAAVKAINREIRAMTRRIGRRPPDIYEIVVAANSTMRDILFGIDVQSIGQKPYRSLIEHEYLAGERDTTALLMDARDVGLRAHLRAKLYGLPLVASHVGGDAAACLEAIGLADMLDETVMLVDMGTNTEVILSHEGTIYSASCPAGPAFEGGLVTYGMQAYDGAIDALRLGDDATAVEHTTIGDAAAVGLCGSGLIDLLAELRRVDWITEKGAFTDDRKRSQITVVPERGITFSREDASNLAQAKAANYSGQYIVLRSAGVDPGSVDRLYLAGAFANYVDVANATSIGLLAPIPEDRIVKVGNAALEGARAVLLSKHKRTALEQFVRGITHVELETTPDFFEIFVEGCQLKKMPDHLGSESKTEGSESVATRRFT